jgi:hypothetical protein
MRLDAATGAVVVDDRITITAATMPAELDAAGYEHSAYSNLWSWERTKVDDWWVEVSFSPDPRLYMVVLTHDDGLPGGWDNWSEERVLAERDWHDEWLTTQLGPDWVAERYDGASKGSLGRFPWGIVGSDYDTRSGGSSIHIRYGDVE